MKDNVKKAFETWASQVNWQITHPLDNNRFMDFLILTDRSGDKPLDYDEFKALCLPHHKDEDRITHHFLRYEFGLDLLEYSQSK